MSKQSPLIFSPTSLADLQRINQFYLAIDPKVRRLALARLFEALKLVERFPNIGRLQNRSGIREFVVPFGKGNFIIRYLPRKTKIHLAHIWHSMEDEL
ncbi:MAG: type II toxin-antitoxin system RelE/ParE family toxin [Deltaproteobacteria bacterium]|nr:type II toxin-antitoxin system RelE/ParE family toxin [Deltaproteobacteria bacterium]